MCLAIPAKIVELLPDDQARIDLGGVRKEVSLALVEDVAVGDYVIIHAGFAIRKLDLKEAQESLTILRDLANAYEEVRIKYEQEAKDRAES